MSASIFENNRKDDSGTFLTATIENSYKDEDGAYRKSMSYTEQELTARDRIWFVRYSPNA